MISILKIFNLCILFIIICKGHNPDFFVLGAQKCGTTSLFDYICQHPDVNPPKQKEINFFTIQNRFNKGIQWYKNQFPHCSKEQITGEATPCYIISKQARKYIKKYFSHAKFIMIMRDPTNRAYSAYNFYVLLNTLPKRPTEKLEFRTFNECINDYFHSHEKACAKKYVSRGLYITHINEWLKLFPKEQFLFLVFEDFIQDPASTTNQVFAFLGLKPYYNLNIKKLNAGNYSNRAMSPETEKLLRDFYRPYNQELERFLGRSLPWK